MSISFSSAFLLLKLNVIAMINYVKDVSGGKADKGINPPSGVSYPFTLERKHSLYSLYLYAGSTPCWARMPVGEMRRRNRLIHFPCWEPISSCRRCSRRLIVMILNDEAALNNDSRPLHGLHGATSKDKRALRILRKHKGAYLRLPSGCIHLNELHQRRHQFR